MFKALTVVLLAVALLVTMKDGRALHDTGLIATCTAVSTARGRSRLLGGVPPRQARGATRI